MEFNIVRMTVVLCALAVGFALCWLVPYALLLRRVQRKYPGYYKSIGRPYTFFTVVDISRAFGGLRHERGKAWRAFARRLYKRTPPHFPKDRACKSLANLYRQGFRFWRGYIAVFALLVIPFDGLALATSTHMVIINHHGVTAGHTANGGSSQYVTPKSGSPAYTPPPTPTPVNIVHSDTTPIQLPKTTVSSTAGSTTQSSQLTRPDLTRIIGSVAPAGQKQVQKQGVCEQVIVQDTPAPDLGPAPDQICTDANLRTYSTY